MKKTINYARALGQTDEEIIKQLIQDYGDDFKPARIKRLVKTGQ